MVLPRIITSIIFVPVVVALVWVGTIPFFIFVSGLSLLCVWEYSLIADQGGYPNQLYMALFGTALLLLALFFDGVPWGPLHKTPSVISVFIFWSFLVFVREFIRRDKSLAYLRIITTLSGVLIGALFLGHLLLIRDLKAVAGEGFRYVGREMTFFLIVVIWTVDTGAWCVGRLIGRHKLAPLVSPKKTWEGVVGGTLLACLVGWFFRAAFLRQEMGNVEAILFTLVIAVSAQFSDLIESLMKRSFGVKDSSQLLPGHGGVLDRFDSFIFAAPFFYYVLIATGRFI